MLIQRLKALTLATALPLTALTFTSRPAQAATFNLIDATVPEIQSAIDSNLISSEYLVQQYLNRIAAYDQQGPAINSIIELNPNALATARSLDAQRQASGAQGSLFGIPVLLKDNIDTFDLPTTAGALALQGSTPPDDAFITQRLRDEGAIILGKANLSEFANFVSFDLPNGFSAVGGQTLNPYGPGEFDVSGSSAGPAAAVASNFATLAVGTETAGSIINPASFNSLVGLKPTVGLVSRDGIIPISETQDTAGPITRTVEDAAILLGALAGVDPNDPATAASVGNASTDYTAFLNADGLQGKRLGIVENLFDPEFLPEGSEALSTRAFADLERLGAELVPTEFPNVDEAFQSGFEVLLYEFNAGLNEYLASLGPDAPVSSLSDIVAFNNANPEAAIPFGQNILEFALETGGDLSDPVYLADLENSLRLSATEGVDALLASLNLDALVYADSFDSVGSARPGYPSITVPTGYTAAGEPLGITFSSDAFSEGELLELAFAYEQGTLNRRAPGSTPAIKGDFVSFEDDSDDSGEPVSVPEPGSSTVLLLVGLGVVGWKLRKTPAIR